MKLGISIYLLLSILAMILFSSCDRPSYENDNPIFDQFDFRSLEYQAELKNQLSSRNQCDVRYWLADFTEDGESTYLTVHMQGDQLCAKGLIKIDDWHKLENSSFGTNQRRYR